MTEVDYRAMYLKVRDELAELQQRTWVGLTDRDVDGLVEQYWDNDNMTVRSMMRAIEAKLKEKNT